MKTLKGTNIKKTIAILLLCFFNIYSAFTQESNTAVGKSKPRMPEPIWPYCNESLNGIWKRDGSLGQLAKTSELILVGNVESVVNVSTNDVHIGADRDASLSMANAGLLKAVTISPGRALLGKKPTGSVVVWLAVVADTQFIPSPKESVLVFLSKDIFTSGPFNARDWNFDRNMSSSKAKKWQKLRVDGWGRGIIQLDGQDGDELLRVVEEYVKHFRGSKRDRGVCFDFLHGLLSNSNERIHLDARVDVLNLVRNLTREDLRKVLELPTMDAQVKDYARKMLEFREADKGEQQ
jgi:hypothetical protein